MLHEDTGHLEVLPLPLAMTFLLTRSIQQSLTCSGGRRFWIKSMMLFPSSRIHLCTLKVAMSGASAGSACCHHEHAIGLKHPNVHATAVMHVFRSIASSTQWQRVEVSMHPLKPQNYCGIPGRPCYFQRSTKFVPANVPV